METKPLIAVYGGSFNPPHDAHFTMCRYIHEKLAPARIVMPFANNPFKDPAGYASVQHRMAMAGIMAKHYPNLPLEFSDIETRIGSSYTCDVLPALKRENPDANLVWIMGADCLSDFHNWGKVDAIMAQNKVAVLRRPGYEHLVQESVTARTFAGLRRDDTGSFSKGDNGWTYLQDSPVLEFSSSALLKALKAKTLRPTPAFLEVAQYIYRHNLYGVRSARAPALKP